LKPSYSFRLRHTMPWPVIISLPLFPMALHAQILPSAGVVTAGSASIGKPVSGAMLVKQATQKAVINWSNFSIGRGNSVTFIQPDANAATLNIVKGNSASVLGGTLKANGSVLLVNQNGITITPSGLVDTRTGFIASSLDMDEADFMAGRLMFNGKGAAVVNQGQILTAEGGAVALLGSTVSNEGLIRAPLGKVALGSGMSATLDLNGDGFLQVLLPASAVAADGQALVNNSGVIQADGGTVMLKASTVRQAMRDAVNMPGNIQARSISGRNGAVVLDGGLGGVVHVAGYIDVAADLGAVTGGLIAITGDTVALQGATLNATGTERGGLVQLGGSFQGGRVQDPSSAQAELFAGRFGAPPPLANASTTTIDSSSSINVSATGDKGIGGTAIVWSNKTTDMQGSIAARGALSGGAVEISSAALVRSVGLKRVDLGKGGTLLLDPQDILIDSNTSPMDAAGDYAYATHPGTVTHLLDADVTALLSAGTTVNLQASQDINWYNNFTFASRTANGPAGNLNLSAGRSVTLSGVFTTADGNWRIIANDTAAHGVIDAERGAGLASIDLSNAHFIGSNGNLSLTLADGAGNTNHTVDSIRIGQYNGNGLNAAIAPSAVTDEGVPKIVLMRDIHVATDISLIGNLQVLTEAPVLSLIADQGHVNWINETSGGTITGFNGIKFVENGIATRLGKLASSTDAVRLNIGDAPALAATRTYGDADLSLADLGTAQLHVVAHSLSDAPNALETILSPGSLAVTGPGVLAPAGSSSLAVSATGGIAFNRGLDGGYFIDLAPSRIPLTITRRAVTPNVSSSTIIYGESAAVVNLGNVVNGDIITPLATLNGNVNVTMTANGSGFGFGQRPAAGTLNYRLDAIGGTRAANYILDLSGITAGVQTVLPKSLTYAVADGAKGYTDFGRSLPTGTLSGIVANDEVTPVVALSAMGTPVVFEPGLPAGTYASSVVRLTGAAAGNYTIAAMGNTNGSYVVKPAHLTYSISGVGTYGTELNNVAYFNQYILPGDTVIPTVRITANGVPLTLTSTTPPGSYNATVIGLTGASAGNYVLDSAGNHPGAVTINPKPLFYTGTSSTQEYGQGALRLPMLIGVVGNDSVFAYPSVTAFGYDYRNYPDTGGPAAISGIHGYGAGTFKVFLSELGGTNQANYTLQPFAGTPSIVTVTPRPVTLTFGMPTSQYGSGLQNPLASVNGFLSNDLVSVTSKALPGTVEIKSTTIPGSYAIDAQSTLSGPAAPNYTIANPVEHINVTVTPKVLSFAVEQVSRASYGDALVNRVTVDGIINGDAVTASPGIFDPNGTLQMHPGVGDHVVRPVLGGPQAAYYTTDSRLFNPALIQITPRELQVLSITPVNSVYGTMAQSHTGMTFGNVLPGDAVTASIDYPAYYFPITERTSVGTYSVPLAWQTSNPNYIVNPFKNAAQLSIAPKPVTYTTASANGVYGGPFVFGAAAITGGVLAGDEVSVAAQGASYYGVLFGENGVGVSYKNGQPTISPDRLSAGSYPVQVRQLGGRSAANYVAVADGSMVGTFSVARRPLLYSVTLAAPKEFGAFNINAEYGQLISADVKPSVEFHMLSGDTGATGTFLPLPVSSSGFITAGAYYVKPIVQLLNLNYALSELNSGAYMNIRQRPLAVTPYALYPGQAINADVYYGNAANVFAGASAPGVLKGDLVDFAASFGSEGRIVPSLPERSRVSNVQLLITSMTGLDLSNYAVAPRPASFNIVPRPVSLSINEVTSIYGAPQPEFSATLKGVLSGDFLDVRFPERSTEKSRANVGSYNVAIDSIAGPYAANYAIDPTSLKRDNAWTVTPRDLRIVGDQSNSNITYGDTVSKTLTFANALQFSYEQYAIGVKAKVRPLNDVRGTLTDLNGTRLDAGLYVIVPELTGPSELTNNYRILKSRGPLDGAIPTVLPSFGTVEVAKRSLTMSIPHDVEYGTSDVHPVIGNVASGETVAGSFKVTSPVDRNSPPDMDRLRDGYYDLGRHFVNFNFSDPAQLKNYLAPSYDSFVVGPKILYGTNTYQYGDTFFDPSGNLLSSSKRNKLDLFLPQLLGSDALPQNKDKFSFEVYSPDTKARIVRNPDGTFYYTEFGQALSVGTHNLTASLYAYSGEPKRSARELSPYYRFTDSSFKIVVVPRQLYFFDRLQIRYGNYSAECGDGCDPYQYGGISLAYATLPTDSVFATLARRPSANGPAIPIDEKTPVGTYSSVFISGLTGKGAENYQFDTTVYGAASALTPLGYGSLLGRQLQVLPLYLTYSTSSGLFIGGKSFGNPGILTLMGPRGKGPINGDTVGGVVKLVYNDDYNIPADPLNLQPNRYKYVVTELNGKNAANYAIYPQNSFTGNVGKLLSNNVGTLDVYADTSFGLANFTRPEMIVSAPSIEQVKTLTKKLNDLYVEIQAITDKAEFSANTGNYGETQSTSGVGSANAIHSAEYLAKVKAQLEPFGGSAEAAFESQVKVLLQSGVSEESITAKLAADALAKIGPTGLSAESSAKLSAELGVAVKGAIGNGFDGKFSTVAELQAAVQANSKIGLIDGAITFAQEASIGGGTSIVILTGLSSSAGSVDIGAGVYSPGSFGGKFQVASGYKDGSVSLGFDLGAKLGIGGVALKFNFSIDIDNAYSKLTDANLALTAMLTMRSVESFHDYPKEALQTAKDLQGDALSRLSFLATNNNWQSLGKTDPNNPDYIQALKDLATFTAIQEDYKALIKDETKFQRDMLYWIQRDPNVAVGISHSRDFMSTFHQEEYRITSAALALGLSIQLSGDSVGFVNK